MDEIELINALERIEEILVKADSLTQQKMLMRVITRMRKSLDELYDREYAQQIHNNPSLVGTIFPQVSFSGR